MRGEGAESCAAPGAGRKKAGATHRTPGQERARRPPRRRRGAAAVTGTAARVPTAPARGPRLGPPAARPGGSGLRAARARALSSSGAARLGDRSPERGPAPGGPHPTLWPRAAAAGSRGRAVARLAPLAPPSRGKLSVWNLLRGCPGFRERGGALLPL